MKNSFELNDRTFTVKALTPGQWGQIEKYLGMKLRDINANTLQALTDDLNKLFLFFAIIVNEEGVSLEDKKIKKLAKFFLFNMDTPKTIKFINFFSANTNVILKDLQSTQNNAKTQRKNFLATKKK